jgi:hypothetical protein
LFSVEAAGDNTRVAVSRGRVRTEAGGASHDLTPGTAWSAASAGVMPIPPELADALAEHEASPPPPVGDYGIVRVEPSRAGAAVKPVPMMLDGRPLAPAPLAARIPAGRHVVGVVAINVAGGAIVPLTESPASTMRAPPRSRRAATSAPAPRSAAERSSPVAVASEPSRAPVAIAPALVAPAAARDAPAAAPELESLYAAAEEAMRGGAREQARRALLEIVAREPHGARAEAALLDLARLSLAEGNAGDARRHLARIQEPVTDPALAEPADHLRCQIDLQVGDFAAAHVCLTTFRRRHPGSPHDAEALSMLAAHEGSCARARPLLEEYLHRYARSPFAAAARARLAACAERR